MKGFLWAMFTSEGLTCGDQRDFGGKHTQELPLGSSPSQITTTSEFGRSDRTNWRDSPQSRNALPILCFHGNNGPSLSLFRLVEDRISIKWILTFKDFNCMALSIDILSGSEHFTQRDIACQQKAHQLRFCENKLQMPSCPELPWLTLGFAGVWGKINQHRQ